MGTIEEKLEYLNETKTQIKNALISKGVDVNNTDTFRSYANKISSIQAIPILQSKSITISSNGTTNITADSGYDGLSNVSVTASVKNNRLLAVIYGHTCDSTSTVTNTIVYYDSTYFSSNGSRLTANSAFTVAYYFRKTTNGTTNGVHYAHAYIGSSTLSLTTGGNQQTNGTKALSSGNTVYAVCKTDGIKYQTADVLFLYLV